MKITGIGKARKAALLALRSGELFHGLLTDRVFVRSKNKPIVHLTKQTANWLLRNGLVKAKWRGVKFNSYKITKLGLSC